MISSRKKKNIETTKWLATSKIICNSTGSCPWKRCPPVFIRWPEFTVHLRRKERRNARLRRKTLQGRTRRMLIGTCWPTFNKWLTLMSRKRHPTSSTPWRALVAATGRAAGGGVANRFVRRSRTREKKSCAAYFARRVYDPSSRLHSKQSSRR